MPAIDLVLFGGFEVSEAGRAVHTLTVRKAKALLAFLSLHPGQPFARERLAALLWGDRPDAQARQSLRQALVSLRRALPSLEQALAADSHTLALREEALRLDVARFQSLVALDDPRATADAVALYRGDLLEGFNPRAPAFDEWLAAERSRLRETALAAMDTLLAERLAAGADEPAIQLAIRTLGIDPLRESAHRALIELYARRGQHGSALRQYRQCRRALRVELGVAPEPATDALYQRVMARRGEEAAPRVADHDAPGSPTARPESRGAEQRQCTIVTIRLADLAALGARVLPEEVPRALEEVHGAVESAMERFGGAVFARGADERRAVFGVPVARTSDAERALRASLAVHVEIPRVSAAGGVRAAAALASGQLLVSGPVDGCSVIGPAVDESARLAASAGPGDTLASAAVCQALAGRLETVPAGDAAHRVVRLRAGDAGLGKRCVARELERRQLDGILEACETLRRGQTVLLRGEAGIGKTTLVRELRASAAARGFACFDSAVLDFGQATGHDAVAVLMGCLLDVLAPVERLETRGLDLRMCVDEVAGRQPPAAARRDLAAMDESARRLGRERAIAWLVESVAWGRPLLLVVEDVHWADPATLRDLASLAAATARCPALLLMSTRVESEPLDPGWRGAMRSAPLTTLDLGPLREAESLELAHTLGGDPAFAARCAARAGGNPLFLEQLLLSGAAHEGEVPDSVRSVVRARIDRLERSQRDALQAAAVIGERFSLEELRMLLEVPTYDPQALVAERLLDPFGEGLAFTHQLVRESVYQSLLPPVRRRLHARLAAWFEERDAVRHAAHLDRGGDPRAAEAYLDAARAFADEHRVDEALELVSRGLAAGDEPRTRFELGRLRGALLLDAGRAEQALEAFAHARETAVDEAGRARAWMGTAAGLRLLDRNLEGLDALAEAEARLALLGAGERAEIAYHRGSLLFPLGRIEECLAAQTLALDEARAADSPLYEAFALRGLGDAWYQRGRFLTAHRHFDSSIALSTRHDLRRNGVQALAMRSLTWFYQVQLDHALEDAVQAAGDAARIGDGRTEALARLIASYLLHYGARWAESRAEAERSATLARADGARRFETIALCYLGNAAAKEGDADAAQAALAAAREQALEFPTSSGPWILGVSAQHAQDPAARRAALAQGEELLARDCISHNYLHFYENAAESALEEGEWAEAERYAAALEAYCEREPSPWGTFFVARARALAAHGRGEEVGRELSALHREALAAGFDAAAERIERAQAG